MKGRLAWILLLMCSLTSALAVPARAAEPEGTLQVLGVEGTLRLFRFETESWPLEAGLPLPDNSRVELEAGAKLRLRYAHYLDFSVAGPARLTVYVVPVPGGGEFDTDRVILKLDEGSLLVDGRFQFGRPADVVLSLPDRSLPLPKDLRFFALADQGHSQFFLPVTGGARTAIPAVVSGTALQAVPGGGKAPALPAGLFDELERPVRLFVIARDYDQDQGLWPRPAVLGPLLAERLAKIPGLTVVEGSGDTYYAYRANGALKSGQDFFLKELGRARGARWVLAGNCVAETPPQESAPGLRKVQATAEVRLLECDAEDEGLELVSESAVTRVLRAGRPLETAAREAMESASDEVTRYLEWHLHNLLQGRAHADVVLKLAVEGVDAESLRALRVRLAGLDSVQRVFRRSYQRKTVVFDLLLRKDVAEFDRQWAAAGGGYQTLPPQGPEERRFRVGPPAPVRGGKAAP